MRPSRTEIGEEAEPLSRSPGEPANKASRDASPLDSSGLELEPLPLIEGVRIDVAPAASVPAPAPATDNLGMLSQASHELASPNADPARVLTRTLDGAAADEPSAGLAAVEAEEAPPLAPLHQLIPAGRWSALRRRLESSFDSLPVDQHRLAQGVEGAGFRAAMQVEIRSGESGLDIRMMPGATFRSGFSKSHLPGMSREVARDGGFRELLESIYAKLPELARRRGVKISVHQMRVMEGDVVERPHRDHYTDYIGMWVVGRRNADGAESQLYADGSQEPLFAKTLDSGEILLLDNRAYLHYVSELKRQRRRDAPAARDVFVFAIRVLPRQAELAPAEQARGLAYVREQFGVPSPNFHAIESWWNTGDGKIRSMVRWLAGLWAVHLSSERQESSLRFLEPSYEPWTSVEYKVRYVSFLEILSRAYGREMTQEEREKRHQRLHIAHRDLSEAIAKAAGAGLDRDLDMDAEKISDFFYERVLKPILEVADDKIKMPEKLDREALIREAAKVLRQDVYRYSDVDEAKLLAILRGAEIQGMLGRFLDLVENPLPPQNTPATRDRERAPIPQPEAEAKQGVPVSVTIKDVVKAGGKLALFAVVVLGGLHLIGSGGHATMFAAMAMTVPAYLTGVETRGGKRAKPLPDQEEIVERAFRELQPGGSGTAFLMLPEWAGEPSRAIVQDLARKLEMDEKRTVLLDLAELRKQHADIDSARAAFKEELARLGDGGTVLWIDRPDLLTSLTEGAGNWDRMMLLAKTGLLPFILTERGADGSKSTNASATTAKAPTKSAEETLPSSAPRQITPALASDPDAETPPIPLDDFLGSVGLSLEESEFLKSFASDIGADPAMPVIGRADEIEDAVNILSIPGRHARSVALVGLNDVGKSAVYHEIARRLYRNRIGSLQDKRLLEIDLPSVILGANGAQRWAQLRAILAKAQGRIIVGVEELGTLNRDPGIAAATADLLGPAIERGEIAVIGTAVEDGERGWRKHDAGLARRFQTVPINEPGAGAATEMMAGLTAWLETELSVRFRHDVPTALIEKAARICEGRLPGKAVRLLLRAANARRQKVATAGLQVQIDKVLDRLRLDVRQWLALKAEEPSGEDRFLTLQLRERIAADLEQAVALQEKQRALKDQPIAPADLEQRVDRESGKEPAVEPASNGATQAQGPLADQLKALLARALADPSIAADRESFRAALFPEPTAKVDSTSASAASTDGFASEPLREYTPGKSDPALNAALEKLIDPALKKLVKQLVAEAREIGLDEAARRQSKMDFASLEKKSPAKASKAIELAKKELHVEVGWKREDGLLRLRIQADGTPTTARARRLKAALSEDGAPAAGESRLFEIKDALSRSGAKSSFSQEASKTTISIDWPAASETGTASVEAKAEGGVAGPQALPAPNPPPLPVSAAATSERMLKLAVDFLNPKASTEEESAAKAEDLRVLMRQAPASAGTKLDELLLRGVNAWREMLASELSRNVSGTNRSGHRVIRFTMLKPEEIDRFGGKAVPNGRVRDLFTTLRLLWNLHPELRKRDIVRANLIVGIVNREPLDLQNLDDEQKPQVDDLVTLLNWTLNQASDLLAIDGPSGGLASSLNHAMRSTDYKARTQELDAIASELARSPAKATPEFEAMLLLAMDRWHQKAMELPDDPDESWKHANPDLIVTRGASPMDTMAAPGIQRLFGLYLRLLETRPELIERDPLRAFLERSLATTGLHQATGTGQGAKRYGALWWTWRTALDLAIAVSERRPDIFAADDIERFIVHHNRKEQEDTDVDARVAYRLLERIVKGPADLDAKDGLGFDSASELEFHKLEGARPNPPERAQTPVDVALFRLQLTLRGSEALGDPSGYLNAIKKILKRDGEAVLKTWPFRFLVETAAVVMAFNLETEPDQVATPQAYFGADHPGKPHKPLDNLDRLMALFSVRGEREGDAAMALRAMRAAGKVSEERILKAAEVFARWLTGA